MHINEQTYFDDPDSFMTVRHLTIRGTNFEIGQKIGEMAIERYGESPDLYEANTDFAKAQRAYFRRNYPIQWEL